MWNPFVQESPACLAAYWENKTNRQGDTSVRGGSLACYRPSDSTWYLAGIVPQGTGCHAEYPGVYTNVYHFLPWIHSVMQGNEYQMK
ncbi:transmembrane protease serine 5-like [Ciona intestinalis]